MFWFTRLAVAQSTDWVPPGLFAVPWDPPSIGGAELFLMSGGGAEWLVVRQEGRTLEGSAAFVAVAATPRATAATLARVACATVEPATIGVVPWTGPIAAVDDALEAVASTPRVNDREVRFWVADEADLVELVVSRAGVVTARSSGLEVLRLKREAEARYDRSAYAARQASTTERASAAMRSMDDSGDPRASGDLAELAKTHPLYGARVTALELIYGRRGSAALDVVVGASGDPAPEVRVAAVKLLGRLGSAGRAALEAASRDQDSRVREAAAVALARR